MKSRFLAQKRHMALLSSSQPTHKKTEEKQKPPSAKVSYFSIVSSIGYTLGTASIPFLQNKAHWQYTYAGQHLCTRSAHFGYLIFLLFKTYKDYIQGTLQINILKI